MNPLGLLLESTIEFSLIAAAALAATAVLRKRSAALRHWMLSSAVACAAIAPLLGLVVPSWQLPIDSMPSQHAAVRVGAPGNAPAAEPRDAAAFLRPDAGSAAMPVDVARLVAATWAAGAAVNLAMLLAGWWRLTRVRSRSYALREGQWTDIAADISRAYGVRRAVVLLLSDHPTLLVTWGRARPKIILPHVAREWTGERMRVVLSHELAHIQRGDWAVQIAAELLRSIHWFNPLAWVLCRQLRHESEHAADDAVLNVGIEGRDYAAHLLDVARAVRRSGDMWSPAPAIVRASTLERRITAMLNAHLDRTPLTRTARFAGIAVLFALAAAIASAQSALSTFSGAVFDPMHRTLPNATLLLTNLATKAKFEVRSDDTGRFEFSELPRGDYALEVKYPGFMALRGDVKLAGHNVQQNLNLEVGTLQETIVVRYESAPQQPAPPDPAKVRLIEEFRRKREREAVTCGDTSHGGNLRPPVKLVDVRPQYPIHLGTAQVGGIVLLEGVIAKDGSMKEVHVTGSAHPDLDAAAVTAVRGWRFDSTLLNCMPIEVMMKVKVTFEAS